MAFYFLGNNGVHGSLSECSHSIGKLLLGQLVSKITAVWQSPYPKKFFLHNFVPYSYANNLASSFSDSDEKIEEFSWKHFDVLSNGSQICVFTSKSILLKKSSNSSFLCSKPQIAKKYKFIELFCITSPNVDLISEKHFFAVPPVPIKSSISHD